jgi:hypothetical protein
VLPVWIKKRIMKTIKRNLKRLLLILGFFLVTVYSNSQDIKLTSQERKEAKKARLTASFYALDSLLNSRSFVLEADYLQNKYGYRVPVVSTLNFIKVDVSNGILQTGTDFGNGYNGVGGVTAEGNIGGWKIVKNYKTFSYTVSFNLITIIGHFDVTMNVNADNNATATITGTTSGRLTWNGHLKTINNARVFKGQNTI